MSIDNIYKFEQKEMKKIRPIKFGMIDQLITEAALQRRS